MRRTLILDSFPLSCMGKLPDDSAQLTERCRIWVMSCAAMGNRIVVPAIIYYETLRELERRGASSQITRLQRFCFHSPIDFLELGTRHLEFAAKLWAQARNDGKPTASPDALDADVILAAQTLSLKLPPDQYIVATTNIGHLTQFVSADLWTNILPGS